MKLSVFQNLVNIILYQFKCDTTDPPPSQTNQTLFPSIIPPPTLSPVKSPQVVTPQLPTGKPSILPFTSEPSTSEPTTIEPTLSTEPTIYIEAINCPESEAQSVVVQSNTKARFFVSAPGTLCTLTRIQTSDTGKVLFIAPVARSYDGNDWEIVSGPYNVKIICANGECAIFIPEAPSDNFRFELASYGVRKRNFSTEEQASRFLEQTTFGPTLSSIKELSNASSIEQWIKNEINDKPISSHREFYRKRSNTIVRSTNSIGSPIHPCSQGSRWHSYSFNQLDLDSEIKVTKSIPLDTFLISVNGTLRTEVDQLAIIDFGPLHDGKSSQICGDWDDFEGKVGGKIKIKRGNFCLEVVGGNPPISFRSKVTLENEIKLTSDNFTEFTHLPGNTGNFILEKDLQDPQCESITSETYPLFASFGNGTFLAFSPWLVLQENTLDQVIPDGGGRQKILGAECSNVPRTFLNIDSCIPSTASNACSTIDNVTEGEGVMICGSPGEVSNDPLIGEFGYMRYIEKIPSSFSSQQKYAMWTTLVLTAPDQLRQRMAWALSQIFAINSKMIEDNGQTELYMTYYDIFVRNAFGNYRDILKEVVYNPLIAMSHFYLGTKSSAFVGGQHRYTKEIFARKIMQLFTIGTKKLNMDGTINTSEETTLSYTNEQVQSFARAWTGFDTQPKRGNIEIYSESRNMIDPLQIIPEWRDVFPKINLLNGYIGDGYPLCVDIPKSAFLRKGAKFRLLGSSTMLELQSNPPSNIGSLAKSMIISKNSELYNKLCNPTQVGGSDCRLESQVVLDENLACEGLQCEVDTLRLIQVTDQIYFEYVRPPCVMLSYYSDAKKVSDNNNNVTMCADPRLPVASEACCAGDSTIATARNCKYVGERMAYNTAEQRCASIDQEICSFDRISCSSSCCEWMENSFWQDSRCFLRVKIDEYGLVAIVHALTDNDTSKVKDFVSTDTNNFFPVYWSDSFPTKADNCASRTCDEVDGRCVCDTQVEETIVFESMPESVSAVLSELNIGSVSPDTFDSGSYNNQMESGGVKAYLYKGSSFDINTIFEVEIYNEKKYYRNIRSTVKVLDKLGQLTDFQFRNPPHFTDLMEADRRDAQYETDAVLDDYFYHENMAPFLATLLIQRFGNSNPSPRYVESVATAFVNGKYGSDFGSGNYGDLGATIAAILLDREPRSEVLTVDPSTGSLREPLLKVIGFMRSMNYVPYPGHPKVQLRDVSASIGQMVYAHEDIYSFFDQHHVTPGPVQGASLVSPEGQRYKEQTIIGLLNGLFSMSKYGLNSCDGGFGRSVGFCTNLQEGDFSRATGKLEYIPENLSNASSVVDELALLLTAGRLNQVSRNIIQKEYSNAIDQESGFRLAQQLIVTTPEFHSTNFAEFSGAAYDQSDSQTFLSANNKSLIYLLLSGGLDSYNVLVPHSNCAIDSVEVDLFAQYEAARGDIALPKDELLEMNNFNFEEQVCDTFGMHPSLRFLYTLYEDESASFLANVGVLSEPVTKENWTKTSSQLFAHDKQQRETMQVDSFQQRYGSGVLGRMKDKLKEIGYNTGSFVISGDETSLVGEQSEFSKILQYETNIIEEFNPNASAENMLSIIADLNNVTTSDSGLFGKTWSGSLHQILVQTEVNIEEILNRIELTETFPNSDIGKQLKEVALRIKAHGELNMTRQLFSIEMGGYDTHENNTEHVKNNLELLDEALESFVKEMKNSREWRSTALLVASEFGRTLSSNNEQGTDHGWGGNYFITGGDVRGEIVGQFPNDLTAEGPYVMEHGRIIPTTSWDSILNGVIQWLDIRNDADLDYVLPNRKKFYRNLRRMDLFFT